MVPRARGGRFSKSVTLGNLPSRKPAVENFDVFDDVTSEACGSQRVENVAKVYVEVIERK